jgi:hypothetical protein
VHNHRAVITFQSLAFFKSRKTAGWTAVLTMLHPLTLCMSLWVELTFALFVLWVVYTAVLSLRSPSVKHVAVFGAAAGLASLTKPVMLLFPLFLAAVVGLLMATNAASLTGFPAGNIMV